jgi:glyoxylase-like metal-dependent hydrolase (beta-lactamase superfamily II)
MVQEVSQMCNQSFTHEHGRFDHAPLNRFQKIDRRTFLAGLGKTGIALLTEVSIARNVIAIALGTTSLAACSSPPLRSADAPAAKDSPTSPNPASASAELTYNPVNLGFVNAYVLVRGAEVAIVDTGVVNSQEKIAQVIKAVGRDWLDVKHVILTHYHPDHAGSMDAVMTASKNATAYAGAEDIPQIKTSAKIQAVADGADVFGLQIIATPGHTPGHISIYDPVGSAFITGDALVNNGGLSGPNPQFSSDMAMAIQSAKKIGALKFEKAYFMHGATIESGASDAIAKLAETLK